MIEGSTKMVGTELEGMCAQHLLTLSTVFGSTRKGWEHAGNIHLVHQVDLRKRYRQCFHMFTHGVRSI